MESQQTNETTLIIPENTFSAGEWREIDYFARVLNSTRGELLAAAWRHYAEDLGEPVPRDEAWFV